MTANPVDLLRNDDNMVITADDQLIIKACAANQPIKAIAAMLQFSAFGWLVLAESDITTMSHLRGKRVGVHGDGQLALDIALAHFNMTRHDLEVVPLGYDYAGALRSRACDAIQGFVVTEPFELETQGLAVRAIPAYEWSYEAYAQVLAANESLINRSPDMLVRFLQLTFDGWRHALAEPNRAVQIITDHYLPASSPALEGKILDALRPFLFGNVGLERLGWMETDRWRQSIGYLAKHNLIRPNLEPQEVMTDQLISTAYQP
jgi:ABC-type nitrate/sulfonate/bicarbonate transport system substrate-binding protein